MTHRGDAKCFGRELLAHGGRVRGGSMSGVVLPGPLWMGPSFAHLVDYQ